MKLTVPNHISTENVSSDLTRVVRSSSWMIGHNHVRPMSRRQPSRAQSYQTNTLRHSFKYDQVCASDVRNAPMIATISRVPERKTNNNISNAKGLRVGCRDDSSLQSSGDKPVCEAEPTSFDGLGKGYVSESVTSVPSEVESPQKIPVRTPKSSVSKDYSCGVTFKTELTVDGGKLKLNAPKIPLGNYELDLLRTDEFTLESYASLLLGNELPLFLLTKVISCSNQKSTEVANVYPSQAYFEVMSIREAQHRGYTDLSNGKVERLELYAIYRDKNLLTTVPVGVGECKSILGDTDPMYELAIFGLVYGKRGQLRRQVVAQYALGKFMRGAGTEYPYSNEASSSKIRRNLNRLGEKVMKAAVDHCMKMDSSQIQDRVKVKAKFDNISEKMIDKVLSNRPTS